MFYLFLPCVFLKGADKPLPLKNGALLPARRFLGQSRIYQMAEGFNLLKLFSRELAWCPADLRVGELNPSRIQCGDRGSTKSIGRYFNKATAMNKKMAMSLKK